MTAESIVDAALELAAAGWAVFPCREQNTPRAKSPYTQHGFKDATRESAQIVAWWRRWPCALVAAPVPESLLVLDIDPRNGGGLAGLSLVTGSLPPTLTCWSGRGDGGRHLYFRRPPGALVGTRLPQGIDLKVSGYCIVAPSIHPASGQPYRWQQWPVATLPASAVEVLRPKVRRTACSRTTSSSVAAGGNTKAAALVRAVHNAPEGRRHNVLLWAGCRVFEEGHDPGLSNK